VDNDGEYFTTDITLGTPPQKMSFLVSTSFGSVVTALNVSCTDESCPHPYPPAQNYTRTLFDSSKSTTFKAGAPYDNNIIGGTSGVVGTDVFSVAGLSTTINFDLATMNNDPTIIYEPIDGVLALQLDQNKTDNMSFLETIQPLLDNPIYTLWLDKQLTQPNVSLPDGQITFGAKDSQHCDSTWIDLKLETKGDWAISSGGLQVGTYRTEQDWTVAIDSQYDFIAGDSSYIDSIAQQIGAQLDDLSANYVVSCNGNLPDIVFLFGGKPLHIPPSNYVSQIGRYTDDFGNDWCRVKIDERPCDWFCYDWIIGAPLLRSFCTAFDFGNNKISFAKSTSSARLDLLVL
jgi:hypothetical protein